VSWTPISSIEEIENAVANLPASELAVFSAWFEAFKAERFDKCIRRAAEVGRLDPFADAALAQFNKGLAREI
jgi:hypothetical protein